MCGYDLMSHLSSSTEGHWSPGSGSVYPVFKDLERKGYVRVISRGDRSKQLYALTERGKEALRSDQQVFNEISKKMGKIRNLMSELVSPENLADLTNEGMRTNRSRWETVLQSKELPKNEKVFKLKEYKLLVENELRWVNDTLRRLG
jgi:DNA-binding PadR family transcriptional regulator